MEAWVTDLNDQRLSLEFRFHVSMCGVLGIGGDLRKWSEKDRAEAADLIGQYKQIRPIIERGDQYRLRSAQAGGFSAVQYVSKDKSEGVLFAFRTWMPMPAQLPPLRLRGLDPAAVYSVEGFDEPRSGAAWMADGLRVELKDDFTSVMRRIQRLEARG
jgi:alpha-galactosidase